MPILRQDAFVKAAWSGTKERIGRRSQDEPQHTLLILTMSAIGATYGSEDWKPLASYLHELGRRIGKYLVSGHVRGMSFRH
jgi:hypothetical protein